MQSKMTHRVTKIHYQLNPGDMLMLVDEKCANFIGEKAMLFKDAKGDPWAVPVSKVEPL